MRRLLSILRALFRPQTLESDFDREIAAHLEMAEDDALRRCLSPAEARRSARAQLGGVTQLRESWRAAWGLQYLHSFTLDAKLGLRMLRRSWGLTLAGGLAMTIVITIAAVAFVFLDEFMGRTAPPLDEGDRIVALQVWDTQAHRRRETPLHDLLRWSSSLQSVTQLGGFQTIERRLTLDGRPAEWVQIAEITASAFPLTRIPPLLGRWIAPADEHPAAPPVALIGYDVWQTRFAANPAILGHTLQLGDTAHTIVGVMPEHFAFPVNHRFWIPLRSHPAAALKSAPNGALFARLAPGVSLERAQAELSTIGLLPPSINPPNGDTRRPRVVPYTFAFTDDVERDDLAWQQRLILLLLSLLLVPPCLNIAILIYARTVTRQEEFAARFALGASRARIVTQLCVEVLVLTSAAGLAALLLTRPILNQLGEIIRKFPGLGGSLPFWIDFQFSWRSVLFVAGLTVLAALIAGLAPALQATGRVMPAALRSMNSRTSIPLGATWTALIVAQVGLALAGLPSAVELAWGHLRPAVLGPGFATREFLTARLSAGPQNLQPRLLRHLASEPGITAVASASALPGAEPTVLFESENQAALPPSRHYIRANHVDPEFCNVFGLQSLSGRILDSRDFHTARTLVVDQTLARQLFPDSHALGRRIRPAPAPGTEPGPWFEIVGVIPDRPANTSQGRVYLPAISVPTPYLALRTGLDSAALSRRLHQVAATLHPTLRLEDVRRLDEVHNEIQMTSNLTSYALAIVTLSVLFLSAAGLYALMSFTVARQRRQIAIRMALGAPPSRMLAAIFARALSQLAIGVAVGLTIALVLHRKLNIEIEGGSPIPGILPAATLFILLIGLLSAAGPARRAIRTDPTEALRDG